MIYAESMSVSLRPLFLSRRFVYLCFEPRLAVSLSATLYLDHTRKYFKQEETDLGLHLSNPNLEHTTSTSLRLGKIFSLALIIEIIYHEIKSQAQTNKILYNSICRIPDSKYMSRLNRHEASYFDLSNSKPVYVMDTSQRSGERSGATGSAYLNASKIKITKTILKYY